MKTEKKEPITDSGKGLYYNPWKTADIDIIYCQYHSRLPVLTLQNYGLLQSITATLLESNRLIVTLPPLLHIERINYLTYHSFSVSLVTKTFLSPISFALLRVSIFFLVFLHVNSFISWRYQVTEINAQPALKTVSPAL